MSRPLVSIRASLLTAACGGFLTSAAESGADVLRKMEVSRQNRVETVQGYVRRANLFQGHVGTAFL